MQTRRPLKSRDHPIFISLAARLTRWGVAPNIISSFSIVFAVLAGVALVGTNFMSGWAESLLWIAAAGGIQFRLICNLLDGMVAIEGGKKSLMGALWNEVPDRFADAAILLGAGYAQGGSPVMGWFATVTAILTAYVRAMGAANGCGEHFEGMMSKPKRMAALTVACAGAAVFSQFAWMLLALVVIGLGSLITCFQRLAKIAEELTSRHV